MKHAHCPAATAIAVMLLLAAPAAGLQVSLPLGPHYRVGQYLAVHLRASAGQPLRQITISGDGIVPTVVTASGAEIVVPVLVVGWDARELRVEAPDQPEPVRIAITELAERQLVALPRNATADAAALVPPAESILRVELDRAMLRVVPPICLEMLHAMIADDLELLAGRTGEFVAAGITLLVAAEHAPDEAWPWLGFSGGFLLPVDQLGPRTSLAGEAAYLPASTWRPGTPASLRRQIVLAAALFAIAVLACALLRPPQALVGVVAVSLIAAGAIALWHRALSPLRQMGGQVAVDHRSAAQWDRWTYFTSARPGTRGSMPVMSADRPILVDAQQAQALSLRLHWSDDVSRRYFEFELPEDARVAFLTRLARPQMVEVLPARPPSAGPWTPLAKALYLRRGFDLAGESEAANGPLVVIVRQP